MFELIKMRKKYRLLYLDIVISVLFLIVFGYLLIHAYLGLFTRYMADDYCVANIMKGQGFWGGQIYWRENWSGRYSFFFLIQLAQLGGIRFNSVLPAIIMFLWFVSTSGIIYLFLKSQKNKFSFVGSLFLGGNVLWATYRSILDFPQIMYWQTGILTYSIFIVLLLFAGIFVFQRIGKPSRLKMIELVGWGLLAFFIGGFSETGSAVQITGYGCFLCLSYFKKTQNRENTIKILVALFTGAVISLIVIITAPGNMNRMGDYPSYSQILNSFIKSFVQSIEFIPQLVKNYTKGIIFILLSSLFVSLSFIDESSRKTYREILLDFLIASGFVFLCIWATIAPSYVTRGFSPPERSFLAANFIATMFFVGIGWIIASLVVKIFRQKYLHFNLIVLVLLCMTLWVTIVPSIMAGISLIAPLKTYATLWDKRHEELLVASLNGEKSVVAMDLSKVKELHALKTKLWLTGDLESFPNYWINRCAAQNYGFDELYVK